MQTLIFSCEKDTAQGKPWLEYRYDSYEKVVIECKTWNYKYFDGTEVLDTTRSLIVKKWALKDKRMPAFLREELRKLNIE